MAVREPAFAKVNVFLAVRGRLPSGYHHLHSLMVFCDIGEWVEIEPADSDSFQIIGPQAPALDGAAADNLVHRACTAFRAPTGFDQPLAITLHKVMPIASGIGGGSADAAATLRALNRMSAPPLAGPHLHALAANLGADVPACLESHPVLLDGVGAELQSVELALDAHHIVLANPGMAVSTPAIFSALGAGPIDDLPSSNPKRQWTLDACCARPNDLQPVAIAQQPVIAQVIQALSQTERSCLVRMSGSGATCFALYESSDDAQSACQVLKSAHPDWWVAASQLTTYA